MASQQHGAVESGAMDYDCNVFFLSQISKLEKMSFDALLDLTAIVYFGL